MENYTAEMLTEGEESREILRCLTMLLGIRAGTQPADRELGISWECLDQTPDTAEALFLVELEDKVERYEPRAEVADVTMEFQADGTMIPHIRIRRKAESE